MFCNKCGSTVSPSDYMCKMCGNVINEANRVPISPYAYQAPSLPQPMVPEERPISGSCVAGFVFSFFPIPIIDIVFTALGFRDVRKNNKSGRGLAIAAIPISIIKYIAVIISLLVIYYSVSSYIDAAQKASTKIAEHHEAIQDVAAEIEKALGETSSSRTRRQRTHSQTFSAITDSCIISVPDYWNQGNDNDSVDINLTTENGQAQLILDSISVTGQVFEEISQDDPWVKLYAKNFDSFKITDSKTSATEIINYKLWHYSCKLNQLPAEGYICAFQSKQSGNPAVMILLYTDSTDYRYDDDFLKMIETITNK